MTVTQTIQFQSPSETAVALGCFNGIHAGHLAVLRQCLKVSDEKKLTPAVFTFPLQIRDLPDSKKGRRRIEGEEDKLKTLETLGFQIVLDPDFSVFSGLSAEEFFETVLAGSLRAKALVCGEDFRFGKNASGDISSLRALCKRKGIELYIVPPCCYNGEVISAKRIHLAIEQGKIKDVTNMLNHEYTLTGTARCDFPPAPQSRCSAMNGQTDHPGSDDPAMREEIRAFFRTKAAVAFRTVYVVQPEDRAKPADGIYEGTANGKKAYIAVYEEEGKIYWEAAFEDAYDQKDKDLTLSLTDFLEPMKDYDSTETLHAKLFNHFYVPITFPQER